MSATPRRRRGAAGRLVLGVLLLAAGGFLLAKNMGFDVPGSVWSYWPLFLIGLGAAKLLWPGSSEDRNGGFWLVVVGIYGWISTRELFGLDWGTAWPIVLVALGLQIALETGLRGRREARDEEVKRVD
ncbi:MAG TPA: DUF5668 domain-containing protein [Thermoanaerobaculia bacterium]|nr:DUF5668 domain-containing protein [Thermoanaerobaculia bacterium]